jgi:hypothetical protein
MDRFVHAVAACVAATAGVLALVLVAAPAGVAASPCADRVVQDWSDNGRVDRFYSLSCYQEAIDTIPADLRDYTNAADVIGRALTAAARAEGADSGVQKGSVVAASDASALPLVPLVGGVFALGVILAGGVAYLARRRGAS